MKVVVIGGGVIGLFSAYYLQQAGMEVVVIDRKSALSNCSLGNAGMIVPSHIVPLAAPGMIAKGLRWMLSAGSPFYIRPRLDMDLIRWGWLFYRHANAGHVQRSIPVLRDLSWLSKQLYQDFARDMHFDFDWREKGLLMLYQTPAMAHEEAEGAALARSAGVDAQVLSGQEVQALEPNTEVRALGGVFYPGDAQLHPGMLMEGLKKYLADKGVRFVYTDERLVFERAEGRVSGIVAGEAAIPCDELLIAAGAWTPALAKDLAVQVPLQGGKGYSFMLQGQSERVQIPAIMLEARATATPMGADLRFAGTMEIAGADLSVNMKRVQGIVSGVRAFYPGIDFDQPQTQQVWSGLRPCSPDGLPYIGKSERYDNLYIASGHGMMGLSLGPATGKLIAEMIGRQQTSMDATAFRIDRF